jgi:hypothetical protein
MHEVLEGLELNQSTVIEAREDLLIVARMEEKRPRHRPPTLLDGLVIKVRREFTNGGKDIFLNRAFVGAESGIDALPILSEGRSSSHEFSLIGLGQIVEFLDTENKLTESLDFRLTPKELDCVRCKLSRNIWDKFLTRSGFAKVSRTLN